MAAPRTSLAPEVLVKQHYRKKPTTGNGANPDAEMAAAGVQYFGDDDGGNPAPPQVYLLDDYDASDFEPDLSDELGIVFHRIVAHRRSTPYRYRAASDGKLIKVEDDTSDSESDVHSSSHSYGRDDDYDDYDDAVLGAQLSAEYHAGWGE